jgi:hypothetical protein
MRKFDTYWEYLLRQRNPWARITNILVAPLLMIMMIIKGVATNQPYFWIGAMFAAVMCVQQHRHYWTKWDEKYRKNPEL